MKVNLQDLRLIGQCHLVKDFKPHSGGLFIENNSKITTGSIGVSDCEGGSYGAGCFISYYSINRMLLPEFNLMTLLIGVLSTFTIHKKMLRGTPMHYVF